MPPKEREVEIVTPKPVEVPPQPVYLALIWNGEEAPSGETNSQAMANLLDLLERYPQIHMTLALSPEMVGYIDSRALDICRRLQEIGRLGVAMVPPDHPILPLLYDTDLASASISEGSLPKKKYRYPGDVRARIIKGISLYRNHFGKLPKGFWPPQGGVAQEIMELAIDCRLEWTLSGEEVLENSLNTRFIRNGQGKLQNSELLYRTYLISSGKGSLTMIFRDRILSDEVNFNYPLMGAEEAVRDFIERLHSIQKEWKERFPPLVTIVINSDESVYFLSQLFNKLKDMVSIKTVTIEEHVRDYPAQVKIEKLSPGSFIEGNFDSWIGEEEENIAWELLTEARIDLESYKNSGRAKIEKLDQALGAISKASNSRWFWWYGQDQNSGKDDIFDQEYRSLLINVYQAIGSEPPSRLFQPVVLEKHFQPTREIVGPISPQIDGIVDEGEWDNAGYVAEKGKIFNRIYYGYNRSNLYLRVDSKDLLAQRKGTEFFIGFYIGTLGAGKYNLYTRYEERGTGRSLAFGVSNEVAIWFDQFGLDSEGGMGKAVLSNATGENTWEPITDIYSMAVGAYSLEIAIPLQYLGVSGRQALTLLAVAAEKGKELESMPSFRPISMILPDLFQEGSDISRIIDPVGDDYGPGTYTYPANPAFKPGSFDIREFSVTEGAEYVILQIRLGLVENPWNSPSGLSLQIIDIYIDLNNRIGAGSMQLLPGRNAYTKAEDAWEYAISVDGWQKTLYKIDSAGKPIKVAEVHMKVDSARGEVTIYVPRNLIHGDPRNWGYLPMVLAYDGEALPRNWRVREVKEVNDEAYFGGALLALNDGRGVPPNIIDLVLPRGEDQRNILGAYTKGKAVEIPAVRTK